MLTTFRRYNIILFASRDGGNIIDASGCGSVWLERSLWEREVQSSNLCTPIAEWRGLGNTLPS